jgi:hypothetical protein
MLMILGILVILNAIVWALVLNQSLKTFDRFCNPPKPVLKPISLVEIIKNMESKNSLDG